MRTELAQETTGLVPVTNGARQTIDLEQPWAAIVTVEGTAPLLFHGWNVESVQAKADARKGSRAKKTDDVNSYVFRDDEGFLCLPGRYLRAAIRDTARYRQDPRSPRKSARDLFDQALVALTEYGRIFTQRRPEGTKEWDYMHRERVVVQRNGLTRERPAFAIGWRVTVKLGCLVPEYVTPALLNEVTALAGRVNGLSDHRPSYGRFQVTGFEQAEF